VLSITADVAIVSLLEMTENFCPRFKLSNLTRDELLSLLQSYAKCILLYHPENNHQERAALLANREILGRHGVTQEEIEAIDFC
jgi:hypothetical protein